MLKCKWCMFVGCCDNTNNGPHYVNAASKHDGPSDPTDEPPFLGHNRNGKIIGYTIYFLYCETFIAYWVSQGNLLLLGFQCFTFLQFNIAVVYFVFFYMSRVIWPCLGKHIKVPFIMTQTWCTTQTISSYWYVTQTCLYRYVSKTFIQSALGIIEQNWQRSTSSKRAGQQNLLCT